MLYRAIILLAGALALSIHLPMAAHAQGAAPTTQPAQPQSPEQAAIATLRQQRDQAQQTLSELQINLSYLKAQADELKARDAWYEGYVKGIEHPEPKTAASPAK